MARTSARMKAALGLLATMTVLSATRGHQYHQHPRFDCPLPQHLSPCACAERDRGLEVGCAEVGGVQLREVLDVLATTRQTIWFLRLVRAQLADIPRDLLQGLDVRNLVLVESNVSGVDPEAFGRGGLDSLDLSGNRLERVPTRALAPLASLSALSLDRNRLEVLEAHAFTRLEALLWLSLAGNRLRLVEARAFLGTELALTRLNLGGNRLDRVPRLALARLNCLQGLRLHGNNITEVSAEHLPPSLCDLDLSGNTIRGLGADAFSGLRHLSALDLEDNHIESVHEDAFRGVHESLEWLKLGGNRLERIPQAALRNLTRLRQLDLRSNRLQRVEADAFHGYGPSLKFIFLQKNRIERIEAGAFDPLECTQWLYLHSNRLTELSRDTFVPIIDSLHVLDIHRNPFECDCGVLWFREWHSSRGQGVVNLPRETQCRTPARHARTPIVRLDNSSFSACAGGGGAVAHAGALCAALFLLSIFTFSTRSL